MRDPETDQRKEKLLNIGVINSSQAEKKDSGNESSLLLYSSPEYVYSVNYVHVASH